MDKVRLAVRLAVINVAGLLGYWIFKAGGAIGSLGKIPLIGLAFKGIGALVGSCGKVIFFAALIIDAWYLIKCIISGIKRLLAKRRARRKAKDSGRSRISGLVSKAKHLVKDSFLADVPLDNTPLDKDESKSETNAKNLDVF